MTNNDQLTGRYFIDHFDNAAIMTPGDLLSYRTGSPKSRVRSQSGVYAWKKTLSATALTETHVGFQRMHAGRVTPDTPSLQELGIRLPLYPTTPNLQLISVDGYFSVGADAPSDFVRNGVEVNNRTNWMKGKHSIQFGGEAQWYKATIDSEYRVPGTFTFSGSATGNAMADFMLGDMRTFDQGTGEYKYNKNFYSSAFFQDDYKIHPRLSLNLGLRYEPTRPWHEVVGRIQIFDLEDYHAGRKIDALRQRAARSVFPWRSGCARRRHAARLQQRELPRRGCLGPDRRRQDQSARRLGHVLRPAHHWPLQQRSREQSAMEHQDQCHGTRRSLFGSIPGPLGFQ